MRDKPNGAKLYSLYNGSVISAQARRGQWYEIVFQVLIDETAAGPAGLIPAGAVLRNSYGVVIGTALADTAAERVQKGDRGVLLTLHGWTHAHNVESNDAVTEALESLLFPASPELTFDRFYPLLSRYDFEPWLSADGFRNYIFYSSALDDPSPEPELVLFFYRGRLSFLLHRNPINSRRITEQQPVAGLTVSYIDEPGSAARREFEIRYLDLIQRAD